MDQIPLDSQDKLPPPPFGTRCQQSTLPPPQDKKVAVAHPPRIISGTALNYLIIRYCAADGDHCTRLRSTGSSLLYMCKPDAGHTDYEQIIRIYTCRKC